MTNTEIINAFKQFYGNRKEHKFSSTKYDAVSMAEVVKAVERLQAAFESAQRHIVLQAEELKPKECVWSEKPGHNLMWEWECNNCGAKFYCDINDYMNDYNPYCPHCGYRIVEYIEWEAEDTCQSTEQKPANSPESVPFNWCGEEAISGDKG